MKRFCLLSLLVAMTMLFVSPPSLFGDEDSGETVAVANPDAATGETPPAEEDLTFSPAELNDFKIDNLWIMLSGCLVFIMHLGFASLEAGLTRQKNTINILFKNTMIISIGLLTYALIGFNVMYPSFSADSAGILSLEAIPNFITVADDPA